MSNNYRIKLLLEGYFIYKLSIFILQKTLSSAYHYNRQLVMNTHNLTINNKTSGGYTEQRVYMT